MYLGDPQLAVFEVAYLLGFSEPSAFNRAFRRWTGETPRDYRRALG
jgi:AraC-like DNA-binding protein